MRFQIGKFELHFYTDRTRDSPPVIGSMATIYLYDLADVHQGDLSFERLPPGLISAGNFYDPAAGYFKHIFHIDQLGDVLATLRSGAPCYMSDYDLRSPFISSTQKIATSPTLSSFLALLGIKKTK